MSLKAAAISGIKWSSIAQFGRQILYFSVTVILARLLSPKDFGLMSMAMVIIGFIDLLKDFGTAAAVIQKQNVSSMLLNSIFWANIAISGVLTILLFLAAPLVALFFNETRIIPILRLLSISFFISGFSVLPNALIQKELNFNLLALCEIFAVITGAVVGISSAFYGLGVWALVLQSLTITISTSVLLWINTSWRPQILFSIEEIRSVWNYSFNLTGFSITNYMARNADYLIIGRFLGAHDLGYYTLAYRIMLYPVQSISQIIGRVIFPIFSIIQNDNDRFKRIYVNICSAIAIITFPLMTGLWVCADVFIPYVFGERWNPVIILILILAPVGLLHSLITTVGTIYQAKGKTDWLFRWGLGATFFFILCFLLGVRWGIVGVASTYAIGTLILTYPSFAIPFRLIELRFADFIKRLWRQLLCSMIMLVFLLIIKSSIPIGTKPSILLLVLILSGTFIYTFSSLIFNKSAITEVKEILIIK